MVTHYGILAYTRCAACSLGHCATCGEQIEGAEDKNCRACGDRLVLTGRRSSLEATAGCDQLCGEIALEEEEEDGYGEQAQIKNADTAEPRTLGNSAWKALPPEAGKVIAGGRTVSCTEDSVECADEGALGTMVEVLREDPPFTPPTHRHGGSATSEAATSRGASSSSNRKKDTA